MNILQITKGALMGGGERHVLSLFKGFRGWPVNMSLAVFTDGKLAAAARELGIEVHVVPKRFRGDLSPLPALVWLIKQKRIDIVHTHLLSGNFYGRLSGKAAGVKGIVTTLHHADREALGGSTVPFLTNLLFHLDISMTAFSDRVITPSADLKRHIAQKGVKPEKIVHIPNAVDLDCVEIADGDGLACRQELGLSPGLKAVGMVGRLVTVKNFPLFLRAARRVVDAGVQARFLVIGDGPLRNELQRMAEKLRLTRDVIFTGFRQDIIRVVSSLDLFVLCSDSEVFPLALIEAMALGKPVIATDV
ncbi:MAG: glycosyltransferase, partial [Nitrospirota bacterium]